MGTHLKGGLIREGLKNFPGSRISVEIILLINHFFNAS